MSISSTQAFTPVEVGVVLAAVSNGVLALQVNRYFRKPGKDSLFLRLFILVIWLATVAHLFLMASTLYILTITNHGRPISETVFPRTFTAGVGLGPFVHSSVQSIYAYRFHKLTGQWLLPAICWALSAYVFGSGIAYTVVKSTQLTTVFTVSWLFYSHFSVSAGVDVLIAASTCWNLVKHRDDSLKKTPRLVNRTMLRIFQTGAVTRCVGNQ
ncbi:hypothetical protein BD779DRAFT_1530629 [Infundibulicybe gibba]|nr:hypothetical protein BD779DRAFT_1530629 [Infundibulicybe gibba]